MVRVICQETFDDVVQENMEELGMEESEAIEEAVAQFSAQGVNLSNIVKDIKMSATGEGRQILETLQKLKNLLIEKPSTPEDIELHEIKICDEMSMLKIECDKDLAHKVLAGTEGAYDVLITYLQNFIQKSAVAAPTLRAMQSLMNGQPDLLDPKGVDLIMQYLDSQSDVLIQSLTLKWVIVCCIKHEANRQSIFNAHILSYISPLLPKSDKAVLRDVCTVLRSLCLDDDIRVEFGQAPEHARTIGSTTLAEITALLIKFKTDEDVVGELLLTMSALIVRNEFCQRVEDAGGLQFVLDTMIEFNESEKLIKQCFKVLKALAGNDDVKAHIIKLGGAHTIALSLDTHKTSETAAQTGLACISAIALRSAVNSKAFATFSVPEIICSCMDTHRSVGTIQRTASWAIRNMVSHTKEISAAFLEFGAERLLNDALKNYPEYEFDLKSALRDLDCPVNFKEQWTGKGSANNFNPNDF